MNLRDLVIEYLGGIIQLALINVHYSTAPMIHVDHRECKDQSDVIFRHESMEWELIVKDYYQKLPFSFPISWGFGKHEYLFLLSPYHHSSIKVVNIHGHEIINHPIAEEGWKSDLLLIIDSQIIVASFQHNFSGRLDRWWWEKVDEKNKIVHAGTLFLPHHLASLTYENNRLYARSYLNGSLYEIG
jgi:hypothetical protein